MNKERKHLFWSHKRWTPFSESHRESWP